MKNTIRNHWNIIISIISSVMLPKSLGSVRHGEGEQASDLTDDRMMYPKNILKMVQQNMIYIYIYMVRCGFCHGNPKKSFGSSRNRFLAKHWSIALRRRSGLTGPDTKASGCGAPVISGDFWGPFLGKQWWTPCQRGHLRRGNKRNPVESYSLISSTWEDCPRLFSGMDGVQTLT